MTRAVTDDDHRLMESLAALNAETATFSTHLFTGELDWGAHIRMTLTLLGVADQVMQRMVDSGVMGCSGAW